MTILKNVWGLCMVCEVEKADPIRGICKKCDRRKKITRGKNLIPILLILTLSGCSQEKTVSDADFLLCLVSYAVIFLIAGLITGYRLSSDDTRRKAVQAGVGYWTVTDNGRPEFHYGHKELPR